MRLKYEFEIVNLDDSIVAVPVGDAAGSFREVIKLNSSAASIFGLLNKSMSEEELVQKISEQYSSTPIDQITNYVHDFVLILIEKGVLEE